MDKQGIALMDFWAPWCKPCQRLAPIIEEIATEYQSRVKIVNVNVDEDAITAARYDVMSIPTLIILRDGRSVERITGTAGKEVIEKKLNQVLEG